jgi:hypothetical protein
MFNMKTINLCRLAATALLFTTLTLAHARPTVASPQTTAPSQQAVMPTKVVFLYVNGIPINCAASHDYDGGHVYSIASGEVVGYVNPSAPNIIVNASGVVIGFLAAIA